MAFCTKCGGKVNKDWKHCPACGKSTEINRESPSKFSKIVDEIPLKKNAEAVINGIPQEFNKSNLAQEIELKKFKEEGKSKDKLFLISGAILVVISLIFIPVSNRESTNSVTQESNQEVQAKTDPELEKLKVERQTFNESIGNFLRADCKPIITKGKGQAGDDNWVMANMEVPIGNITFFPERYINQGSFSSKGMSVEEWGNQVDKTLIFAAAYEQLLAPLYWEIYGMWDKWSELGKYKTQFTSYLNKVNGIATKLCYTDNEPSDQQLKLAEKYSTDLVNAWPAFNSWREEVWAKESDLSDQLEYDTTPRCTESKTNNPNYNIVTCTNLP